MLDMKRPEKMKTPLRLAYATGGAVVGAISGYFLTTPLDGTLMSQNQFAFIEPLNNAGLIGAVGEAAIGAYLFYKIAPWIHAHRFS